MGVTSNFVQLQCGSQWHTLSYHVEKGVILNDHGKGFDVILSLGGAPSQCHRLKDEILRISKTHIMPVCNVFAWYASGFDEVRLLAWGKYATPQEVHQWMEEGVNRSHMVRKLHDLGVLSPNVYREWKKVSLYEYNKTPNIHVIAEYVKNGVSDPAEALMWKNAGLTSPNLLSKYLRKGWSPQKLAKANKAHPIGKLGG